MVYPMFHSSLLKKAVGQGFVSQPLPEALSEEQQLLVVPKAVLDVREDVTGQV